MTDNAPAGLEAADLELVEDHLADRARLISALRAAQEREKAAEDRVRELEAELKTLHLANVRRVPEAHQAVEEFGGVVDEFHAALAKEMP